MKSADIQKLDPAYSKDYYDTVYSGFDDFEFAVKWARACRIITGVEDVTYDRVLEFGAGLGQNLAVIDATEKWAIDVSSSSCEACRSNGIHWTNNIHDVPDGYFDLVLSRHSLEHVSSPSEVLGQLRRKITPSGRFFLTVPLEDDAIPDDIEALDEHSHLFSWTPMTIKNLLLTTGWKVDSIQVHSGRWFRKTLPLTALGSTGYRFFRKTVTCLLPKKSAEIIVSCTPN